MSNGLIEKEINFSDGALIEELTCSNTSITIDGESRVMVDNEKILIGDANQFMRYKHACDRDRIYHCMRRRQEPKYHIKIDVQWIIFRPSTNQPVHETVVKSGDIILSFKDETQLDIFQDHLHRVGYKPYF